MFSATTWLAVLVSILLRLSVSLHSYSGEGESPMYGDYEAQRHWMEITANLPLKDWYFNTTDNDLLYWGLDYPPLTAYHSMINGFLASYVNPNFTSLGDSRGYESYEHKVFMRATVVVADLFIFIPAVWWFFSNKISAQNKIPTKSEEGNQLATERDNLLSFPILMVLLYPGLILIDHGHFQYNNISLGLFIAAVAALTRKNQLLGSIFFCLALNYKQMELYHALPFFFYLLGECYTNSRSKLATLMKILKLSLTVVATFFIIWLPFLKDMNVAAQVVVRLFPLARGVFEDKVANVWCALNIIYKLRLAFTNTTMAKVCLMATFVAILPSSLDLLFRPSIKKFLISLINCSLAFFLFSFQVHEKSILIVAIPVCLHLLDDPFPCFWFLIISVFSMLPLLAKDGLMIPTLALITVYGITIYMTMDFWLNEDLVAKPLSRNSIRQSPAKRQELRLTSRNKLILNIFFASMAGCIILTQCFVSIEAPDKYPDLYPLLISVYSCAHFCLFFAYFNYQQIFSPSQAVKVKTS